jgi:hypothetical protein
MAGKALILFPSARSPLPKSTYSLLVMIRIPPLLAASLFLSVAAVPLSADLTNVAMHRPVVVDSVAGVSTPGWAAVNGNNTTSSRRWVSNISPMPHWIEIALDGYYELSQFKFWSGESGNLSHPLTGFQLQSWDGDQWQVLHAETNYTNGGAVDITFPAQLASDRIRMFFTAGADNRVRLYELEVYGAPYGMQVVERVPGVAADSYRPMDPITVEFNAAISAVNTGAIEVRALPGNTPVPVSSVALSGSVLSVQADLQYDQVYEVIIPQGALALAADPSILNPPVFWSFTTLPEAPQVADYSKAIATSEAIEVVFDRPVELLDGSSAELINYETGAAVDLDAVTVSGHVLTLTHVGLDTDQRLMLRLPAGMVRSPDSSAVNTEIALGVFSGEYELVPLSRFTDGLDGFIPAHSVGVIPLSVRVWGWLGGMSPDFGNLAPGPSGDFRWVGRDRGPAEDFIATPALDLIAGEDYTVSFSYEGTMRVDLRDVLQLDREQVPLAAVSAAGSRDVAFTAESSGIHHLLFSYNGPLSFSWVMLDDVSVVRTVRPAIFLNTPAEGFVMAEGQPLEISGNVFGFSSPLDQVEVFLDDRLVGTFFEQAFHLSLADYDPGEQELRIVARDARGAESEITRPITITFPDGTLEDFVQYSFRSGLDGVQTNASWRSENSGYLNFHGGSGVIWMSTPRLFLQAGESYVVQFLANRVDSNNKTVYLSLEDEPGYPVSPVALASFDINAAGWVLYQTVIHVEANGGYHLTLYNVDGADWSRLQIDNFRVVGLLNSAPSVSFIDPANNTRTLAGAPIQLAVNAADADGYVTRVEFWNGSFLIGTVYEPPYSLLWESAPVGDLTVTALAYDNAGAVSNPASVKVESLENRVNISTNMGTDSLFEYIRGMAYQDDGTLVAGGVIHPGFFSGLGVTPQVLPSASADQHGVIVRMSEDGRTVLSVSVVGEAVADLSLDAGGNIYVAAGPTGILKLNPAADTLLWHYTPADMGISQKLAHRIDTAANGMTAALMSPTTTYGVQTLAVPDIALVHPDGSLHPVLMGGSGGTYTTDIAVDTELERVWIAGWKNFRTWEGVTSFPVDVPIFAVRSYASDNFNERVIRGYDWESNDDNGRWLNRLDNNMADTRTQRVTIAPNGDVYIGLEYDGGNTPLRYDPFDLSKPVQLVGGDTYHNNAFTSTVPKVAVIRLDRVTGAFKTGQYMTNRLASGADNTVRLRGGELLVDTVGRVHIVGDSAAGTPLTFDVLPGVYNGGAIHWVLSPDLSTREMVTRWAASGSLNAIAISPSGKIAVGGNLTGDTMYRRRAMLSERQSSSDALLVVGDFANYYSFQPGNHPRLFFTAQDIPELRYRATQAPFDEMVQRLIESLEHDGDYQPFDPNHTHHRSMRAKISAFLYVLTGDEAYALSAREDVEWVIAGTGTGTHFGWADPSEMGLRSYSMATRVALAYDWCALSPHWDDAFLFHVSKSLLDIAKVVINNGGTQQNPNPSSNWQGARGSSGGLALLATDSRYDPSLLDAAYQRVRRYINESVGDHPLTRGWAAEGIGYTYYPYGLFVGPFGEAMARITGRDLRDETAISAAYRSLMTAPTAAVNVYDYGGIKPDWSNDNMHMRGEGIYGQAFYYLDPALLPAARWIYDRIQGPLARDRARWDDTRGGTIWTFLHYPVDVPAQSPLEFHAWHSANSDQHGIGITTFRNQYEDETDILSQFKARHFTAGGHDGPDGLGFRIIGNDTAWVVGGGRDDPGKRTSQATLYTVEPGAQAASSTNLGTGTLVGAPLVKVDGGGHVIARMDNNNMNVANHKRWYMTDFDSAATGAQAAFLVADTSVNATYWQLPTSPFNTITTSGNTFTITSPNGDTLRGTVLHPAGATLAHGTRPRGSGFSLLHGGSLADRDPILNPEVNENKFVTVHGGGGDFLVAFTIQPAGEPHPAVSKTSGTVDDAVVQIGNRSYTITTDNILYDGQIYSHADALIVFDVGPGTLIEGEAQQTIAYGARPTAPVIDPPTGHVFLGWSHAFDAVTRDMVIEAVYAPIEGTPAAPSFLRGTAPTGGFIALQWNDNSIGETGFTVEESSDGGQSWSVAATLPENSTGVTLSGRAPLSQFHYRVRAEGTEAPSDWSNTLVLNTPALNQPPFFTSTPPTLAHEGAQFNYFIQAEDPEEDSMLLALVQGPEWLSLYNSGGGAAVLTGIPVADTDTVDVTVSVSDGINPAVEQSFTLAINPAPAINLIWPGSLPVYLSARHGIYVEAEVIDDDAPVTVTWAVVQGPTGTVIDDPQALETGIYFDRAGTYTVRITAVDALGARSEMEFPVLVDRQIPGQLLEVLSFDKANQYVSAATHFRNVAPSIENLDINGNGVTDTRRFHAFSTTEPLNPAESEGIHGGRFYGGYLIERFNGTSLSWQSSPGFTADGGIAIRFNSALPATVDWVLYWAREDFKDVHPGQDVFLGPQSSLQINIQQSTSNFLDVGDLRWLVRANDTFYVSQSVITNTSPGRTLSGPQLAAEMWAEYTPTAPIDLNFDQANAIFSTPTENLGPVEAVGFIVDADDTSFNRRFRLIVDGLRFQGEVIDALDLAPVIDLGTLATVQVGTPVALDAAVDFAGEAGGTEWAVVYGPGTVTFGDETSAQTTVTASLPGEYRLRLSAWTETHSSFREVVWLVEPADATPPNPLQDWLEANFGELAGGLSHPDAALDADPDKDGIPNLMEFALRGNPLQPRSATLPVADQVNHSGNVYLRLTVEKNPEATDIRYIVEVSGDLQTWSSVEGSDVHTLLNTTGSLMVEDAIPLSPEAPRFIRLRVEYDE